MTSSDPAPLAPPLAAEADSLPAPPPYGLRGSEVIAVGVLSFLFVVLCYWPLWHTDVWAHLKFGQWIVQHRELPAQEPFSPFAEQKPYIHFQWLSQAATYLVFAAGERLAGGEPLHRLAGGVEMLGLFFAVVGLLRCLFLLLSYRRVSGSMPLALASVLLALVFVGRVQRPQLIGEMFFAALLFLLGRPVLTRRALVLIPFCLVLWANVHGSYAVGLALLGLVFFGRAIEAARRENAWSWRAAVQDVAVRRLFLAGLLSAVAIAVLNPHGPWLFLHTWQFSQQPNIASMDEWKPLDFRWEFAPIWGYAILLVLLIVSQIVSSHVLSPTRIVLCVVFGLLPLWQQRMMVWWAVLFPWIILPSWAEVGRRIPWSWLHYRSQPTAAKTLLAGFLIVLALLLTPAIRWLRGGQPRPLDRSLSAGTPWRLAAQLIAPPDDRPYLPKLAEAVKSNYPDGRYQGRIFASETQGDYLLWALPSDYPVMVYTHVHLFSPEHWRDCLVVLAGENGWQEVLDQRDVNLLVFEVEQHVDLAKAVRANPNWQIILDEAGLSSKRDPRTRLLIALRKKPLAIQSHNGG